MPGSVFAKHETDILVCCPQKRAWIRDESGEREEVTSYAAYIPGTFHEEEKIFVPEGGCLTPDLILLPADIYR